MAVISHKEIWDFLLAIEGGAVTLSPHGDPQDIYSAAITYHGSNGWKIVIFNDCNQWDYIEEIVTDDGRRMDYDEIFEAYPDIDTYCPSPQISWSRYLIPADQLFHCLFCGATFDRLKALRAHKVECK